MQGKDYCMDLVMKITQFNKYCYPNFFTYEEQHLGRR